MIGSYVHSFGDIRDRVSTILKCFKDPPITYALQNNKAWVEEKDKDANGGDFDSPTWTIVDGYAGVNW